MLFTLGYADTIQSEVQQDLKEYFTTNKKLGIPIRKRDLRPYYTKEKYRVIWFQENNATPLNNASEKLLQLAQDDQTITQSVRKSFNLPTIQTLLAKYKTSQLTKTEKLQLDLLLTNLYDKYINAVAYGCIDWKSFKKHLKELLDEDDIMANWEKYNIKINKPQLLHDTLHYVDFEHILQKVEYTYPNADKLYAKLLEYEKIAKEGGYVKVPKIKKSLKKGMRSDVVPLLRERLIQSHDFITQEENLTVDSNATLYDSELIQAVKSFQRRYGLTVDGICGPNTIKHLNISLQSKINQIRVNLERMRWMPRNLGKEYLLVNIPDFHLRYFKENKQLLQLPVVVGNKKHPTPIFSRKLSAVILNPYWRVPKRIVQRELVPKLIKNPNYILNKDITIHENWDSNSEVINPEDINWTQYAQTPEDKEENIYPDIPYRFIQTPGKRNALGKMKFMFYNKYMVYMHDTNAKYIFHRRQRAYSHGCIRVCNPHKLLKTIASEEKTLDYKEAQTILKDVNETAIDLNKRIPVHIVYLTAWVDRNNTIHFRDDIYGYDKMQEQLLH